MEKLKIDKTELIRLYDFYKDTPKLCTIKVDITNDNLDKHEYSCFMKGCKDFDDEIIKKLTFGEDMFWNAIKDKSVKVLK